MAHYSQSKDSKGGWLTRSVKKSLLDGAMFSGAVYLLYQDASNVNLLGMSVPAYIATAGAGAAGSMVASSIHKMMPGMSNMEMSDMKGGQYITAAALVGASSVAVLHLAGTVTTFDLQTNANLIAAGAGAFVVSDYVVDKFSLL